MEDVIDENNCLQSLFDLKSEYALVLKSMAVD